MTKKPLIAILFGLIISQAPQVVFSQVTQETAIEGVGGMIKSRTDIVLSATTSGNLVSLEKKVGDAVTKGDVVAKIECSVQKAGYARTKAELQKARINVQSKQQQHTDGILSPIELEEAQADLAIAKASERQQLIQISLCTVKATSSGFIVVSAAEVGQWVNQGEPIAQIVDTDSLYIALNAPEATWAASTPGATINALVETTGTQIEAVITMRSNYITENGVFSVEADITNSADAIPGMRVIVQ